MAYTRSNKATIQHLKNKNDVILIWNEMSVLNPLNVNSCPQLGYSSRASILIENVNYSNYILPTY